MAVYRAQIGVPMDSALPRDIVTINPHYEGNDPDALAQALKANFAAWSTTAGKTVNIKIYDAKKAPPSYPLATASTVATNLTSSCPREVALCLSYFTGYNRPRFRGRLYLPATWFTGVVNLRPSGATITAALDFSTNLLTKSLPGGTWWTVFSKTEMAAKGQVSDVWVDDEWDTVRSRGLDPTLRQTKKLL